MQRPVRFVLVALALAVAACNGQAPVPDEPAQPATGEGDDVTIEVQAGDIFYQPDGVELPAGSMLTVNFNNEGNLEHDFHTDEHGGCEVLQAGESDTCEIGPIEESVTAYCTVPGHREAGMEFEITVTD